MSLKSKTTIMSIPKQPRQLMINLMYIVLTALLALNVSAEILQAFFSIDRSLGESSQVVQHSNEQMMEAIRQEAAAYPQFTIYLRKAEELQRQTQAFRQSLDSLRAGIVEEAGGLGPDGQPVRKMDKDIPTRILVNEGQGEALERRVRELREQLLSLVEEEQQRRLLATSIPLNIPEVPETSDKKGWAQYTFQQMPVAAVLPILRKFENDVEVAESAILNYFLSQMGTSLVLDAYVPVIASEKNYVISGEEFRSEIFLAAYSTTADNIRVSVDGRPVAVEEGKALFSTRASGLGERTHRLLIELEDPLKDTVQRFEKTFSYLVGERSVAVSADKMNVLYVGVENPLTISAAGVPSSQVRVQAEGTALSHLGGSRYMAKPGQPGEARITVSGGGMPPSTFHYRVKRIPDPAMELGRKRGGRIEAATFRAQLGIIPVLENFDFEARCNVISFELVRVPKGGDIQVARNNGGRFESEAQRIVRNAAPGDVYYFNEIKVKCPGDTYSRELNGMIFTII